MNAEPLNLGIHGAAGRMGQVLIRLIAEDPALRLAAAFDRPDHPRIGADAGSLAGVAPLGVALEGGGTLERGKLDVLIDFSQPRPALELARACRDRGIPLVVGTTGFEAAQRQALEECGETIPLLVSPNMSRAVNLLMKLVETAARSLAQAADIEVVERHHRRKKDAPSGTALRLAEVAAQAAGRKRFVFGRQGLIGERSDDEIGIHALRGGDAPGDHTVVFSLLGETLELTHRATTREAFARGALEAAKFLARRPPGLYSMEEVCG